MAKGEVARTSLAIECDVLERAKDMALELGCRVPTGRNVGEGSIAELLRRWVAGELRVERGGDARVLMDNLERVYGRVLESMLRLREAGVGVDLPTREKIPPELLERYDKVMAMGSDALIAVSYTHLTLPTIYSV